MDGTQIMVAALAGIPAIAAAVFAYRTSSAANRQSEKKVDAEVFERTQALYEKAILGAEREIDRLQQSQERMATQIEKMSAQLTNEQDTASRLRGQMNSLQAQVQTMEGIIQALRGQIELLSGRPSSKMPSSPN